jgi:tetratricopeptide (TPR) repeat protein
LKPIDNYFTGQLTPPEKMRFEQQIVADPHLAESVAFYVQARQTARQQAVTAQAERKAEWATLRERQGVVHKSRWAPMSYAAAACVLLLLGFFVFWPNPSAPAEVADRYIRENLTTLPITMSGQPNNLQLARQAYNTGQFAQAETLIASWQKRQPDNTEVLELAGLVSLRQGDYDKAIGQFHRLSQRTDLQANPGLFYESIARLKRNQSGDEATARKLLQTAIDQNLDGKKGAKELIDDL